MGPMVELLSAAHNRPDCSDCFCIVVPHSPRTDQGFEDDDDDEEEEQDDIDDC
ncbi:hypothetical protein DPMN_079593 [Dreissena polymorpha]|uniref:Uncharacterized protein n=1 Tax=Dreissena polymorpha TaxID=45954 RepID=A0A9D4BT42_DREPO|nr:hypothetical protein DPMN_079593 [Dreissena polymorpha]